MMMNVNRLVVLSKCAHIGKGLLACNVRHAGREALTLRQRRSFRSHARNLAYAKDLFLGQVNKAEVFPYPEIGNEEVEEINQLVAPVERFFNEEGEGAEVMDTACVRAHQHV
ncbi:Acyl-CoA dehydrogenase family member 9 [Nibea albiflora]|uniref:Acyl-CoA dehydrogenase family member 9 n=1 Tax=Nibea albiflora TaxID=240163 RepID=A0ACB7EYS1_NIBAL|nr:Acyl-CoA dehydrogenase family member 9 [Nibea albiflora]